MPVKSAVLAYQEITEKRQEAEGVENGSIFKTVVFLGIT